MDKNISYIVTWFADGMLPEMRNFDTEEKAVDFWDKMVEDTHKSLLKIEKVEVIRRGRGNVL